MYYNYPQDSQLKKTRFASDSHFAKSSEAHRSITCFPFFFFHTFLFNSPLATKIIEKTKSQPSDQQQ